MVQGDLMLIVAVMGLIFNLIQIKILHSGDGHYHLGGDHDHAHGEGGGCSHSHAKATDKAKSGVDNAELKGALLEKPHDHSDPNHKCGGHEHKHDHTHEHKHDHAHDHAHDHKHDHKHDHAHEASPTKTGNINVDAAFLHVLGDMLMSVGVIIAATFIYFWPSLWMADPLCTYLFSIIVVITTLPVFKSCIKVMMESAPANCNVKQLEEDIAGLPDVLEVHDLHVWALSMGKNSMSVHIKSNKPLKALAAVTDICRRKYNLFHTTIQVEGDDDAEKNPHVFSCQNDIHE